MIDRRKKHTSPYKGLLEEIGSLSGIKNRRDVIDDRDFKLAPNFMAFSLDYLNAILYPKQIEIACNFFNDRCPFCTNPDYWELFDESLGNILDNTSFLEYGVCPDCGRNRAEIIEESDLNWYNELIGVAGQRSGKCITGNSMVPTKNGTIRIDSLTNIKHKYDTWIDIDVDIISHKGFSKATKLYRNVSDTLLITTRDTTICGTPEHPILVFLKDSVHWLPLEDLEVGDFICVVPNTFDKPLKYEPSKVISIQKSGSRDVYDFNVPKEHSFVANGVVNHNSFLCAQISTYVWHWYTKIPGIPAKAYGLHNTRLYMTFTGLSHKKVLKNLWVPFTNYIKDSPWFNDYHNFLADECKRLSIDIESVLKFKEESLLYKHKNLEVLPQGPDVRKTRGDTAILSACDEVGWMLGSRDALKINPDGVYTAVTNALATIRTSFDRIKKLKGAYHFPTGYSVMISSPSSARDKIMRLLYQSRKQKNMYAYHLPTWEMNPYMSRESLEDYFEQDPVAAETNYGAMPPLAENPFVADVSEIYKNQVGRKNCLKYRIVHIQTRSKKIYTSCILDIAEPTQKPMLMGIDAGYKKNSFAVVLTSYNEHGQLVIEGALEAKPQQKRPINFPHVYRNVIKRILEEYNIIAVFFDQWQSIDLIQLIDDDFGVEALRYSPKYVDFEVVRQRLLGDQVKFAKIEKSLDAIKMGIRDYETYFLYRPLSHLILQIATVQDTGRKVTKTADLDDDIFRAFALCCIFTWEEDYKEQLIWYGKERSREGSGFIYSTTSTINRSGGSKGLTIVSNDIGVATRRLA